MSPSKLKREGRKAYEDGYMLADCPYQDSWYRENWKEGYLERQKADDETEDNPLENLRDRILELGESPDLISVLLNLLDKIEGLRF